MSEQDGAPVTVQRLLGHYGDFEHLLAETPGFVIGQVLEEGCGQDLVWLTRVFPEDQIVAWLQSRGPRQLSRRSRLFWERVLSYAIGDPPKINNELWPL